MREHGRPDRESLTRLAFCGVVLVSVLAIGAGPAGGQSTPDSTYYYGTAVSEDGANVPAGTTIAAVVDDGDGTRTIDRLTMETDGEYGGSGLGDEKLQIPGDVEGTVFFEARNDFGTFTAAETVQNPESGTRRLDLTFPAGAAESRPYFDVSGLQPAETTAVEGETLNVSATVENTGSEQGTQTVSLAVDGSTVGSREVSLGPGSQETVSFTVETGAIGAGEYSHRVATADTSQSGNLTVEARRAAFTVSELDPTELTVVSGESVHVSATVTNEGNAAGTQTVALEAGDTTLASTDVTLEPDARREVTFESVGTESLAAGTYTHAVVTANGSETGTLTVEARRAEFTVAELDPPDRALTVGAEFAVTATVRNDGNAEGQQAVMLTIGGRQRGDETVTLAPGERRTLSFPPVNTSQFGPGTYSYSAASANDSRSGTLVVESDDPATFTVVGLTPQNPTVTAGERFGVEATVRNDGDQSATRQVEFRIDGETVERTAVTLAGGSQATVTFSDIQTGPPGAGTYTHGVYTDSNTRTGTLTVEADGGDAASGFVVSELTPTSASVTNGTAVDVSATVTNEAGREATERVSLRVDGELVDSTTVTLGTGEQTGVSFTVPARRLSAGVHAHSVVTDGDRQDGSIRVTRPQEATATPRSTGTVDAAAVTATTTATARTTANATERPTTTQSTPSGDSGGGGLLPGGVLGTLLTWVGLPLVIIYGVLKALAIYLGY